MGKPKKYLTTTINFGEVGHPARTLIELFLKKHGNNELSKFMRKLVLIFLSDKPEYSIWKDKTLIHERKAIGKEIAGLLKKRADLDAQLEDRGIDPDEVIYD